MTSPITLPHGHGDAASDQYTKQLGRLILSSSHLEATCSDLARAMRIDPAGDILAALQRMENRARAAMPPWASVRADDLVRWSEYARHLLSDRIRLFAALPSHRFTGSDGDAPRLVSADGSIVPADERYLDRMVMRTHRHDTIGVDLRLRLEYVDPRGMNWPLGRWHLESSVDPELDQSVLDRLAQLPPEWRTWLETDAPVDAPAA